VTVPVVSALCALSGDKAAILYIYGEFTYGRPCNIILMHIRVMHAHAVLGRQPSRPRCAELRKADRASVRVGSVSGAREVGGSAAARWKLNIGLSTVSEAERYRGLGGRHNHARQNEVAEPGGLPRDWPLEFANPHLHVRLGKSRPNELALDPRFARAPRKRNIWQVVINGEGGVQLTKFI
jgi:hypothetical protein